MISIILSLFLFFLLSFTSLQTSRPTSAAAAPTSAAAAPTAAAAVPTFFNHDI